MTEETKKEEIPNKFRGKGKLGLYCPFRTGHYCNANCGMFCIKLSSCVFHGINLNLQKLIEAIDKKK
jgi:hypothetical protein